MKRMGLALLAAVVLGGAIAMTGCGGGGSDSPTASVTDVSGTWTGTATTEETGTLSTYCVLTQSGTSVSGTWEVYAVSGSIDGSPAASSSRSWPISSRKASLACSRVPA